MGRTGFAAVVFLFGLPVAALGASVPSYVSPTVLAAEQALVRLGYDIGTPDGKWDKKSNKAMNELRAANGLPSEANFTGSSLALIHRLSPGTDTLPSPGLFVTDVKVRRAELATAPAIVTSQCKSIIGQGTMISFAKPIATIDRFKLTNGVLRGDDDWFSAYWDTFLGAESDCLAGNDRTCKAIVDYTIKSASTNAFAPVHNPPTGQANEDEKWVANVLLRDLIVAYGIARQFAPPSPVDDATVLDWLKRRVDLYHNIVPGSYTIGDRNSAKHNNHGLAHVLSAFVFGVLVGDRAMMQPALETYREILEGIRVDGSIPTETRRGSAWFHYSNVQISQLLMLAEMASAQGIDADNGLADPRFTIPHAVSFLLDGLHDFDIARPYAKANEQPTFGPASEPPRINGLQISWLPAYIARFGEDDNVERMRTMTVDPEVCSPASVNKDKLEASAIAICGLKKDVPVTFSELFLMSDLRSIGHLGYAAGCMQATSDWRGLLSSSR